LDQRGDQDREQSIGELLGRVAETGRAAVEAEIGVWKAIAAWRLSGLRLGLPARIGAFFIGQSLVTAMFIGLVIALAPVVGAGWAVLIMTLIGLALIGVLIWFAMRRLRTLVAPLPKEEPKP